MTIHKIRPSGRPANVPHTLVSHDCGPEACEIDWLVSDRVEVDDDISAFTSLSLEQGWGDGLPLVPPTENRVRAFLSENHRYPDKVIGRMPDSTECTVEKIVVNAVMAGARPESLELIIAALEGVTQPDFELYGVNATTASVYPAFVVNGPIRKELDIPCSYGCAGGVATQANAIGRAIRLVMRNVAGQVAGVTSQTTFGSPGRLASIVMGEFEERSPWAPLAERRGVSGNAVTAMNTMGTMNILDTTSTGAMAFIEMIGKSVAYPAANCFSPAMEYSEMYIGINPICADLIAREISNIEDVQEAIWKFAKLPGDWLQEHHRVQVEAQGRIREDGFIYATPEPKDIILFVAGGLGGLHALGLHSFGSSLAQTRALATVDAKATQAA
ncbi:hypothetical protein [Pontixanthobacter aquaemixtae]|uniref:Uncharacterized protein n=1 Tax=Pontixanthobacter aquaemixtae TaxID=1958940 RepID=A0A844ZS21_9SPHN|nr:hypothetical protein [Pontixanthobacter aquaemixtae]MXO89900.1 hypothetical protein [Pontixanthobacter aquaemixtae]